MPLNVFLDRAEVFINKMLAQKESVGGLRMLKPGVAGYLVDEWAVKKEAVTIKKNELTLQVTVGNSELVIKVA